MKKFPICRYQTYPYDLAYVFFHLPRYFFHYSACGPDQETFWKSFYKTFKLKNSHVKKCQQAFAQVLLEVIKSNKFMVYVPAWVMIVLHLKVHYQLTQSFLLNLKELKRNIYVYCMLLILLSHVYTDLYINRLYVIN